MFADFDGTLSPIVDDPAVAAPVDGVVEVLSRLAERYAVVGVVSGRPVSFLASHLDDPQLRLSGLYGLESQHRREHTYLAGVGAWREVVDDLVAESVAGGPDGMVVESKGLAITLHFRSRPDLEAQVKAWAQRQAERSGLRVHDAKMSVELRPPIDADKGSALLAIAGGLSAVCFLGDDLGDLPAFDALDRLARSGVATVRVAIRSAEAPPELLERADVVLDGPGAGVDLLRSLLPG